MKSFYFFLTLILILISCKQKQKFDYSLLEGSWLLDSVTVKNQDTTFIYNLVEDNQKTMRFYLFSEDMIYDVQVDSFYSDKVSSTNKTLDEYYHFALNYEIVNDTFVLYEIDRTKLINENDLNLIETSLKFKTNYLSKKKLILEERNSFLFYSKTDYSFHIRNREEELKFIKNYNSN